MGFDNQDVAIIEAAVYEITDFSAKKSALLKQLMANNRVKYNDSWTAGVDLFWNPKNGYMDTVRSISDYQELTGTQQEDEVKVTAPMSTLGDSIIWSGLQEKRDTNAGSPRIRFDRIAERMAKIKAALAVTMAADLYNDGLQRSGQPNVMKGLRQLISQTTTIYGVDRSVTAGAYARSQKQAVTAFTTEDAGGAKEGYKKMQKLDRSLRLLGKDSGGKCIPDNLVDGGEDYDSIFAGPDAVQLYLDGMQSRTRFEFDSAGKPAADAGYGPTTTFNRKPMYEDAYCLDTSGGSLLLMYFLNFARIQLRTAEKSPLLFDVYAEDSTGNVKKKNILGQHCLVCQKPSAQGILEITA